MDTIKLSTGVAGYSDTNVVTGNVVPIRPSKIDSSAAVKSTQALVDRYTPSSVGAETPDGIADVLTFSSPTSTSSTTSSHQATVARVIAAVQGGTYHVDTNAVADAVITKMMKG